MAKISIHPQCRTLGDGVRAAERAERLSHIAADVGFLPDLEHKERTADIRKRLVSGTVFLAFDDGEVVGFAGADDVTIPVDTAGRTVRLRYIHGVLCQPKRGIGGRLMAHINASGPQPDLVACHTRNEWVLRLMRKNSRLVAPGVELTPEARDRIHHGLLELDRSPRFTSEQVAFSREQVTKDFYRCRMYLSPPFQSSSSEAALMRSLLEHGDALFIVGVPHDAPAAVDLMFALRRRVA